MISTRFPRLLLMVSVVALAACTAGKAQQVPPPAMSTTPTQQAPVTNIPENTAQTASVTTADAAAPVSNSDAAIYARLSRVEADVAGMKDQMSQMGPLLQKMPALQDKLGELVTELQRIDQRVASAQEHAATLQAPASAPVMAAAPAAVEAPATTAPAPAAAEAMAKPAPAKGLVTPTASSSEELLNAKSAPMPQAKPATKVKGIPMKKMAEAKTKIEEKAETKSEVKPGVKAEAKADAKPEVKAAPAATTDGGIGVKAVRLGDDAQKSRLVLDVTKKASFTYDLDNSEKILIIDLDASAWAASPTATFAKSPLVASYNAQAVEGGKYRLVIQLKDNVKVQTAQALPPNGEKGDRIVFDLVKVKH